MRIVATIAVFSIVGLAVASTASPATAQYQSCLALQMELAKLEGKSPTSSRKSAAIARELDSARAQARKAGCRNRLFSRNRGSKSCRALQSRISKLQRQLNGSRPRGLFGFGRSPEERRRASIRSALRRSGCSLRANTYRTVCVRVCDGYYFPLSFAVSRHRLATDAAKCINQYELGEATLFYYPNPGGDVSQALSLSGERYFQQPYAFQYRSAFHRQCAARLHQGLASLGRRVISSTPASAPGRIFEAAVTARMATPSVPIPIPRDSWTSDPETLANRAGSFVPVRRAPPAPPAPTIAAAAHGEATRTVGEEYYFAEANPGPPATVAGYTPPELHDFRARLKSTSLPVTR